MRRFSNVVALAVIALPVTGAVLRAQASIAARLRQLGGFAVPIMMFVCFPAELGSTGAIIPE
jgi:hypothetical protein